MDSTASFHYGNWRVLHLHVACWLHHMIFCPPVSMVKDAMKSIYWCRGIFWKQSRGWIFQGRSGYWGTEPLQIVQFLDLTLVFLMRKSLPRRAPCRFLFGPAKGRIKSGWIIHSSTWHTLRWTTCFGNLCIIMCGMYVPREHWRNDNYVIMYSWCAPFLAWWLKPNTHTPGLSWPTITRQNVCWTWLYENVDESHLP